MMARQHQDIGALILDWTNLDRLGVVQAFKKEWEDAQFSFFQSLTPFNKPELEDLKFKLEKPSLFYSSLRLLVHGVFIQQRTPKKCVLITPLIHCLEMLFNETNPITAERHLKICVWILSIYMKLSRHETNRDLIYNQCVCQTVTYHQSHHHLNISMDINALKRQCYKQHITPLQILLSNLHPKQRKCPKLNISSLCELMFSAIKINQSISTVYITINDLQKQDQQLSDVWICTACTLQNAQSRSKCLACEAAKPVVKYTILSMEGNKKEFMKYKQNLMVQCSKHGVSIDIVDYLLKLNIHKVPMGHIRLLMNYGICPFMFKIQDDSAKIICDISLSEIMTVFDSKFSILKCAKQSRLNIMNDVYLLMVIQYEAKKDLTRILSLCELCNMSTILRNYLSVIADYIYGDTLPNDDIYDNQIRTLYAKHHLTEYYGDECRLKRGVKNPQFFIYWLSKYCLPDSKFLDYYAGTGSIWGLKDFCSNRHELKHLMYQFEAPSSETYDSFHY